MKLVATILSVGGLVAWSSFAILAIALSGLGDGAAPHGNALFGYCILGIPFVYLGFVLLSSFGVVHGRALAVGGLIVHCLLVLFLVVAFLAFGFFAIIFAVCGVVLSAIWYGVYCERMNASANH